MSLLVSGLLVAGVVSAVSFVPPAAGSTPTSAAAGTFESLTPSRLLDTRGGLGGSVLAPGGTLSLLVDGRGGVPASGVAAVVLNLTVTEPTGGGYVTVWGDGTTRPTASNLNFAAGATVSNLVVAFVGATGEWMCTPVRPAPCS